MAQQHHEIEHYPTRDVLVLGARDGTNGGVHLADEKDFKNMRLSIGTLDKTIFQISLSDDLTDTRHIDILLKRSQGQAKETAKGDGAPPSGGMAMAPGRDVEEPPEVLHAATAPRPQARLKITVAAEEAAEDDAAKQDNEMRGWYLTVATLFVSMAFDAMLHPPEWMRAEWYEKGWFRTRHDLAAINPSHAAAAAAAPSPQPATASASQAFRAYFYLSCNSLTFAMALALVLMLLDWRQKSTSKGARISMETMVKGVSLFLALTFALGTSNNWKVTGIACVCLLVYTFGAFWYLFVYTGFLDAVVFKRKSKTSAKQPEKKMPQDQSS